MPIWGRGESAGQNRHGAGGGREAVALAQSSAEGGNGSWYYQRGMRSGRCEGGGLSRIMEKLCAESVADLVRLAGKADITPLDREVH
jgi:hypothetical protein